MFSLKSGQITLREGLEPAQRLKTLVHELAHALLHRDPTKRDRHLCELEAEACAYLVCDALSLDTARYSFPYLAHWAEDPSELLPAAERGSKAAQTLLEVLDNRRALTGDENCREQYHHVPCARRGCLTADAGQASSNMKFHPRLETAEAVGQKTPETL